MIKKLFKNLDYSVIILVILLFVIGIISLKSASMGAGGDADEYSKQIIWFLIGLIISIIMVFVDYKFFKKLSVPFYLIMILLLIVVLKSNPTNGATSWIKVGQLSLQPSEFFKISVILVVARFIEHANNTNGINKWYNLLICILIVIIPTLLIIKQPDYGTAIVILGILLAMLFAGGINWKYILVAVMLAVIIIPIAYNFALPEHAKKRIEVYLNPESDPRGAGYNAIQSKLAVGSGMIVGMGLFNGNQTQMGLLPMKTTDFIFSVISEEMGFIVSAMVVGLYMILQIKIINISRRTKDTFGKMICIGTFAMIFIHVIENIGMCIGLLPITGIPLPFISYGGSSMLTCMILIGMINSISARKKKHLF